MGSDVFPDTSGFNPRSRMGSDEKDIERTEQDIVSIHAPAWGATFCLFATLTYNEVSIHAPAWGATLDVWMYLYQRQFQSTLPHGERQDIVTYAPDDDVSIHAPAWGATGVGPVKILIKRVSIHAPAWGATRWWDVETVY